MSTKHVVHRIYIPGLAGDGFDPGEASLVRAAVEAVAPPDVAPYVGAALRQGPHGPDWAKDAVSADWYSNPNHALDAAGPGGTVRFSGNTTYELTEPILLLPNQRLIGDDAQTTMIQFNAGSSESVVRPRSWDAACNWVTMKNLRISGKAGSRYVLDARNMSRALFENLRIEGAMSTGAAVIMGGDTAYGGWSNTFIKGDIWGPLRGACLELSGKVGGTGARNANNNTIKDVVMNIGDHADSIGVNLVEGDSNKIEGCDIGYSLGTTTSGGWPIIVNAGSHSNRFLFNRTEMVAHSVLVRGGNSNVFFGNMFSGAHATISPCRVEGGNPNRPNMFMANGYSTSARDPLVQEVGGPFGTVILENGLLRLSGGETQEVLRVSDGTSNRRWGVRGDARMFWPAPTDSNFVQTTLKHEPGTGALAWSSGSLIRLPTVTELPTANVYRRGVLMRVEGSGSTSDKLYICERNASGTYVWREI